MKKFQIENKMDLRWNSDIPECPEEILQLILSEDISFRIILVFVMDGCKHCINLEPNISTVSKNSDIQIYTVMYGGARDKPLMEQFQVTGFPTILKIENQCIKKYDGDRSIESLTAFSIQFGRNVKGAK